MGARPGPQGAVPVSVAEAEAVLEAFRRQSAAALLFLKSVRSVALYRLLDGRLGRALGTLLVPPQESPHPRGLQQVEF